MLRKQINVRKITTTVHGGTPSKLVLAQPVLPEAADGVETVDLPTPILTTGRDLVRILTTAVPEAVAMMAEEQHVAVHPRVQVLTAGPEAEIN